MGQSKLSNWMVYFCLLFILTGCFGKSEQIDSLTKVSISIPTSFFHKNKDYHQNGNTRWGVQDPTSVSEIKCIGIAVNWGNSNLSSCSNSSGAKLLFADAVKGTIDISTQTQTFDVQVPSGNGRSFAVIGFAKSANGTCPNISSISSTQMAQLSSPLILGNKIADIVGSTMNLTIDAKVSTAQKISTCSGPLFAWEAASSTTSTPITLTSSSFESDGLKLIGTNLDSISSASISADGVSTTLTIISKSATEIFFKASSSLSVAIGKAYSLLISSAVGQSTFSITVNGTKTTFQEISSSQTVTPTLSDTTYLASSSAITVSLPNATNYGDGFKLNVKNGSEGVVTITDSASALIDGTSDYFYLVSKASGVQFGSYNGKWYSLASHGIATGQVKSCSGDGTGDNQCYTNTTLQSNGIAIVGSTIIIWDGVKWYKSGTPSQILIKDSNSMIGERFTTSLEFATIGGPSVTGYATGSQVYYVDTLPYKVLTSDFGATSSGCSNDQDGCLNLSGHLNTTNVCTTSGMRLPNISETDYGVANGVPSTSNYSWTSKFYQNDGSGDLFYTWQNGGYNTSYSYMSNKAICVISASALIP